MAVSNMAIDHLQYEKDFLVFQDVEEIVISAVNFNVTNPTSNSNHLLRVTSSNNQPSATSFTMSHLQISRSKNPSIYSDILLDSAHLDQIVISNSLGGDSFLFEFAARDISIDQISAIDNSNLLMFNISGENSKLSNIQIVRNANGEIPFIFNSFTSLAISTANFTLFVLLISSKRTISNDMVETLCFLAA